MSEKEKNQGTNGFTAFLVGGLLGAAVALLYAPRAGDETRRILFDTGLEYKEKAVTSLQEAKATAKTALAEAEERLGTLSEEGKSRLGKLQEIGKNTLREQKESLKTGLEEAKKTMSEPAETESVYGSNARSSSGSGATGSAN
jgi:gas vesicle protein